MSAISNDLQKTFVAMVERRMMQMGINGTELCDLADVCMSHWSEIKNGKKKMGLASMQKFAGAVGLEITIQVKDKTFKSFMKSIEKSLSKMENKNQKEEK